MKNNSTLTGKCTNLITAVVFFFISFTQAQSISPELRLAGSAATSGSSLLLSATHRLSNVTVNKDAVAEIQITKNGVKPIDIDDST